MNKSFWQIWLAPLLLAVFTVFGLLSALLGVGVWHWLAWSALVLPLAVVAWYLRPRDKSSKLNKLGN